MYRKRVQDETRPCVVNGMRAIFHKWYESSELVGESPLRGGHPGGAIKGMHAIVEYENGAVECVHPCCVRFADNACSNIWAELDYAKALQDEDFIKMLTGPTLREDQILK